MVTNFDKERVRDARIMTPTAHREIIILTPSMIQKLNHHHPKRHDYAKTNLYKVEYEDGDCEELTESEVRDILVSISVRSQTGPPKEPQDDDKCRADEPLMNMKDDGKNGKRQYGTSEDEEILELTTSAENSHAASATSNSSTIDNDMDEATANDNEQATTAENSHAASDNDMNEKEMCNEADEQSTSPPCTSKPKPSFEEDNCKTSSQLHF